MNTVHRRIFHRLLTALLSLALVAGCASPDLGSASIDAPFNWRLGTVPAVGHNRRGMAIAAAAALDRELRAKR